MSQAILEMKGICKSFASVPALIDVDFSLKKGEIHALVGGNGAGKSTLMKIITGVYTLNSGEIFIDGEKHTIENADDAKKHGIAMIFQELSLINTMTVAENIFLGEEKRKGIFRDKAEMNRITSELLQRIGLDIDPSTPISKLSVGASQMVEIAKALSKNAKILVLDEPTSSLSDTETEQLFKIMRDLKASGVSMVYISHRMNEILEIADSITILKDGRLVDSCPISDMTLDKIISKMMGGEKAEKRFEWVERNYNKDGDNILSVEHLAINEEINDISFSLKKGEILGFAGLMGSGRTEILETIFGVRKKLHGQIKIEDKPINIKNQSVAIKAGLALIPEDRRKQGLILGHTVKENAVLPIISRVTKGGIFVDDKKTDAIVDEDIKALDIKTSGPKKMIKLLSGGNQQKVVIAKWLNVKPKIMMLDEPTAGVDIGAKSEIIGIIREFANQGNGVIFVSSELAEMMAVCDRILTIFDGKITGELLRKNIKSEEELQHAIQNA